MIWINGDVQTVFGNESIELQNEVGEMMASFYGGSGDLTMATQEQIDATCTDPDLTGSIRFIYDVAADGKTIIGSAGYGTGGYNWVLKLDNNLHDETLHAVTVDNSNHKNITSFYTNDHINILGNADYIEIYTTNGQMMLSQQVTTPIIPTTINNSINVKPLAFFIICLLKI